MSSNGDHGRATPCLRVPKILDVSSQNSDPHFGGGSFFCRRPASPNAWSLSTKPSSTLFARPPHGRKASRGQDGRGLHGRHSTTAASASGPTGRPGASCRSDRPTLRSQRRCPRVALALEELFARPEWRRPTAGHDGRCSCCGAAVGAAETICGCCGAIWTEPSQKESRTRLCMFGLASISLAMVLGFSCSRLFSYLCYSFYDHDLVSGILNQDFIKFVEFIFL